MIETCGRRLYSACPDSEGARRGLNRGFPRRGFGNFAFLVRIFVSSAHFCELTFDEEGLYEGITFFNGIEMGRSFDRTPPQNIKTPLCRARKALTRSSRGLRLTRPQLRWRFHAFSTGQELPPSGRCWLKALQFGTHTAGLSAVYIIS